MEKSIAEEAGLSYGGIMNGEPIFIGTEAQWKKAEELEAKKDEMIDNDIKSEKEEDIISNMDEGDIELSNTHPTEGI